MRDNAGLLWPLHFTTPVRSECAFFHAYARTRQTQLRLWGAAGTGLNQNPFVGSQHCPNQLTPLPFAQADTGTSASWLLWYDQAANCFYSIKISVLQSCYRDGCNQRWLRRLLVQTVISGLRDLGCCRLGRRWSRSRSTSCGLLFRTSKSPGICSHC